MVKRLQLLISLAVLTASSFAKQYPINIVVSGSPSVAQFENTALNVTDTDTIIINNTTNFVISLTTTLTGDTYPLPENSTISYGLTGGGINGIFQFSLSSSFVTVSETPLVLTIGNGSVLKDTDEDGVLDYIETALGTDPNKADTDGDGIEDGVEFGVEGYDADTSTTTNPLSADTDGGGVRDGDEDLNKNGSVDKGETDPNLASDDKKVTSVIDNTITNNELSVYPQPAVGSTINVNQAGNYEIYSQTGTLINKGYSDGTLNVSELTSGYYILKMNGKVISFIK
ncbi:MAG: T9SS type A sorting domain-containing protein [Cytophagales bacterium]